MNSLNDVERGRSLLHGRGGSGCYQGNVIANFRLHDRARELAAAGFKLSKGEKAIPMVIVVRFLLHLWSVADGFI